MKINKIIQELSIELSQLGGRLALKYFQSNLRIESKSDNSLVSKADKEVEKLLIRRIKEVFPDHQVYGEESGGTLKSNNPVWIIDPIEGTTNFLHGIPVFGTQIAVLHQNEIIAAAMYDPVSETSVAAAKDEGTYLNGKRVDLKFQSLENITLLFDTGRDQKLAKKFLKSGIIEYYRSFRRLGSLIPDVIFLCNNQASAYFGFTGKIYDFAPAALILSEAGYSVVDESLDIFEPKEIMSIFAFHPDNAKETKELLTTVL